MITDDSTNARRFAQVLLFVGCVMWKVFFVLKCMGPPHDPSERGSCRGVVINHVLVVVFE